MANFWRDVVRRYTARKLTQPLDKLVAISAIAKHVAIVIGDQQPEKYLAGLWRQHLTDDLMWAIKSSPQPPPTYRAPSWSWASVDGNVEPKELGADLHWRLEVLDAKTCSDSSAGPFSSVTGGYIVVKGSMKAVSQYVISPDFKFTSPWTSWRLDAVEPDISWDIKNKPVIWLLEGPWDCHTYMTGQSFADESFSFYGWGMLLLENTSDQSFRRIGSLCMEGSDSESSELWV